MTDKLASIQALRGAAVLGVCVFHATESGFYVGAAGVDLFFVISGFIIARISVGRNPVEFYLDRLWRIFPPYLLCTALLFVIADVERSMCGDVVSLTLLPLTCEPYLIPAWTLVFEMLFYTIATACISRPNLIFSIIGACVAIRFFYPIGRIGSPLMLEFLAGVALARAPVVARLGWPPIIAAVVILALSPKVDLSGIRRALWWGIPAALIVYGALNLQERFKPTPLVEIGNASYSIYLTHLMVLWAYPMWWPLVVWAMVVTGIVFHFSVERPLLRLKPSSWRRRLVGVAPGQQ